MMDTSFRHAANRAIQYFATRLVRIVAAAAEETTLNIAHERVEKILLVRPSFRMGNSILATPAIFLFRQQFPSARIDFVGGPTSKILFENLPINNHYEITGRFPDASWAYLSLRRRIRRVGYDLAVELSGSQSAMGAVIVGLSGARYRAGMRGKWDRWYNVKLIKPVSRNKYESATHVVRVLGIESDTLFPRIVLSLPEKQEALRKVTTILGNAARADVAVFVGGRIRKQKRWPKESFVQLIRGLQEQGLRVLVFVGPEERDLVGFFRAALANSVPVIYESSLRLFAAMISTCRLFVACDSGPIHLACALGVRTVAIFQRGDFAHWGPPSSLARIVHEPGNISPATVLQACLVELGKLEATLPQVVQAV